MISMRKKKNVTVFNLLEYISGAVLNKAKIKIFQNCAECKETLFDKQKKSLFIKIKEFSKNKSRLKYPNDGIVRLVSEIHDVTYNILKKRSWNKSLKAYIKTILYVVIDTSFLNCTTHKKELTEFIFDYCSRFFIFNWCDDTNKLLRGDKCDTDESDPVKLNAKAYFDKRKKRKITHA